MRKRIASIALGLFLLGGVWAFYQLAENASRGGESAPLFSIHRYDPYGTAALREFFESRGIPVRVLKRPRIKVGERGVLIQVLAAKIDLGKDSLGKSNSERTLHTADLLKWISEGNTVVQFTRGQTALMDTLGVRSVMTAGVWTSKVLETQQRQGKFPSELTVQPQPVRWLSGSSTILGSEPLGGLSLRQPSSFFVVSDLWHPLARASGVVAGVYSIGKGRAIFVGAPTPALNGELGTGGNLDFIVRLVGAEPVIIDEWSHGFGHSDTIIGLIKNAGLWPIILQILFVVILYSWSTYGHQRADEPAITRRRSVAEQVETLGHLYGQALSLDETRRRVHDEVISRVAKALRCTPDALLTGRLVLDKEDGARVQKIVEAARGLNCPLKRIQMEAAFAHVLKLSYQFCQEKQK